MRDDMRARLGGTAKYGLGRSASLQSRSKSRGWASLCLRIRVAAMREGISEETRLAVDTATVQYAMALKASGLTDQQVGAIVGTTCGSVGYVLFGPSVTVGMAAGVAFAKQLMNTLGIEVGDE